LTTDKIYLVGFMAAGKTTVAQLVARQLGWQAFDLDAMIEQREGRTIADIFATSGEPYFRKVERTVLQGVLSERFAVVATGGGTYAQPANRADIDADGLAIWLDVPLDELMARIPTDGRRPLFQSRVQIQSLFDARRMAYGEAPVRLDARGQSPDQLAERLLDKLRR
jgi:shikimate kinase